MNRQDDAAPTWPAVEVQSPVNLSVYAPIKLIPASEFTFDELGAAYNQTRVDYIVPMPMNTARLREYVSNYDVSLELSAVAMDGDEILGLAMLGVRPSHSWITRLGVLPVRRRRGTGQMLMEHLIVQSRLLGVSTISLEVIKGNEPAYRLFRQLGFCDTRELMIVRRPPGPPAQKVDPYIVRVLEHDQAVEMLGRRRSPPSWLDETPSLCNAGGLVGLCVDLDSGGEGWLVYQAGVFQLGRLVLQTEAGDPQRVARALAHALHQRHPAVDTKSENLPAADPHWPALKEFGYIESFRRIEMVLELGHNPES